MSAAHPSPRSRHPRANTCNGKPVEGVLAMLQAGKTQREVAKVYGVSRKGIEHHAERHGVFSVVDRRALAAERRAKRAAPLKEVARLAGICTRAGQVDFALRYRDQYSASEIAEALGVSRCTVIGIWWRARASR